MIKKGNVIQDKHKQNKNYKQRLPTVHKPAKTFDSVDKTKLIEKLLKILINEQTMKAIQELLNNLEVHYYNNETIIDTKVLQVHC